MLSDSYEPGCRQARRYSTDCFILRENFENFDQISLRSAERFASTSANTAHKLHDLKLGCLRGVRSYDLFPSEFCPKNQVFC